MPKSRYVKNQNLFTPGARRIKPVLSAIHTPALRRQQDIALKLGRTHQITPRAAVKTADRRLSTKKTVSTKMTTMMLEATHEILSATCCHPTLTHTSNDDEDRIDKDPERTAARNLYLPDHTAQ